MPVKELIFLGTGTSSCIPQLSCVTRTKNVVSPAECCEQLDLSKLTRKTRPCVCWRAMEQNSKNRRNNTSLLIRYVPNEDEGSKDVKNIVIDCGKTFYQSALQWFTKYHIHTLDAVIITHEHADAFFGLDELREWSSLEKPLDVYLSRNAYEIIRQSLPYLTDPQKATGGGKVSILNFVTFDDEISSTILNVCGLSVLPVRVIHGERTILDHPIRSNGTPLEAPPLDHLLNSSSAPGKAPFYAFGYRFEDITYISDVSKIPDESKQLIIGSKILIVDALFDVPGITHQSHFSVDQALSTIDELGVNIGILTGFGHSVEHQTLQTKLDERAAKTGNQILRVAYDGMIHHLIP